MNEKFSIVDCKVDVKNFELITSSMVDDDRKLYPLTFDIFLGTCDRRKLLISIPFIIFKKATNDKVNSYLDLEDKFVFENESDCQYFFDFLNKVIGFEFPKPRNLSTKKDNDASKCKRIIYFCKFGEEISFYYDTSSNSKLQEEIQKQYDMQRCK